MKRVVIPELLDSDLGSPDEVRTSLADLRRINRWFGGMSTTRALVKRVVDRTGRTKLSLLEVAAGSGDIPLATAHQLRKTGVDLEITLLDRATSHLDGFRPSVAADALALPFRDESFDVISCALFAHHLEPLDLQIFITETLRVSRVAVLINDLRRSALHLALIYAGMPLFRSRLTRHDAIASVRRAYTPHEIRTILHSSGVHRVEFFRTYLCRMGILIWKDSMLRVQRSEQATN
ncbi:MAG TPA: methyltransferase domain-containing protein [Terriglobales bacterium]|nr:methyltransferase domain-containing protein [Terriglobales bacterium]